MAKERSSDDSVDWRATKNVLCESFFYLLENQLNCDVQFIVGSGSDTEKIPAHKLLLLARSKVFCAMFSEKWAANSNEIELPDIEPGVFKDMLKFLYSDDLELTLKTVTALINVAEKYDIYPLQKKCSDFLSDNLCPENVFNILITARHFHMEKLVNDCLDVIAKNTDTAINTDDFIKIDIETLYLILERSDLRINELRLFDAVDRWAEEACIRKNRCVSSTNKRLSLKNALDHLRFPVMKPEDFSSKVVESGLLTENEIISVLLHFNAKSKTGECKFLAIPRRAFLIVNRFRYEVNGGKFGSSDPSSYHQIKINTSGEIKLVGIGLYGTADFNHHVDIILQNCNGDNILEHAGTYYCCDKIFRIFFSEPITITDSCGPYILQAKIKGQYSTYGCGGVTSETIVSKIENEEKADTITFSSIDKLIVKGECDRGHRTDLYSGQIPELLFEP